MKRIFIYFFFLYVISASCYDLKSQESTSEFKACTKIHFPSRDHCRISPVRDGWKCCLMTFVNSGGNQNSCVYVEEEKSKIDEFIEAVQVTYQITDVKVDCSGKYFSLNILLPILLSGLFFL